MRLNRGDMWGEMRFNSCRTLTGEGCKLMFRNMLFIERWVALKRAFLFGKSRKKAHIPHVPSLLSLLARRLSRRILLCVGVCLCVCVECTPASSGHCLSTSSATASAVCLCPFSQSDLHCIHLVFVKGEMFVTNCSGWWVNRNV